MKMDSNETNEALSKLFTLCSRPSSLPEMLGHCLDDLLSISWLSILPRAGIFLVETDQTEGVSLRLVAERNLESPISERCARVPVGHCLCGRVAQSKKSLFTACVDERHETQFEGMEPHGHYNIPILSGDELLGVMVFYLPHGVESSETQLAFMEHVAGVLALSIKLRKREADLVQINEELQFQKHTLDEHAIVSIADGQGNITYVNDKFCEISGYSREELLGKNHRVLKSGYHTKEFYHDMWRTIAKGKVWHGQVRNKRKEGGYYWVDATIIAVLDEKGKPKKYVSIRTDITAQKELELVLNQAQKVAHMGSWRLDLTNDHLLWSDEIFEIFGIDQAKFGANLEAFFDCIHPDDLEAVKDAYQASLDKDIPYDVEHRIVRRSNSEVRWVHELCVHERIVGGQVIRSVGTVQDITERKAVEEKLRASEAGLLQRARDLELSNSTLERQAQEMVVLAEELHEAKEKAEILAITDRLTGLFNRLKLDQTFSSEFERCQRYNHPLSVVICDLDHFKSVNDTFGHQVGDEVLKEISKILKENVRTIDIPGRWGGEEFLVICPETDLNGARVLAEKIRQAVEVYSFPTVGHKTASFGVAELSSADSMETLTQRSDEALYRAKSAGRNRVES